MKFPFFQTNRSAPAPAPAPSPRFAPTPARRPEPSVPPAAPPTKPATTSLRTAPPPGVDLPAHIRFKLRSILALLPDEMRAHPHADMSQRANPDQMISLPADLIIPQLAGARVTVPLAVVLDAVPVELLSPMRPDPGDATVALPLREIVAQLPPGFFTARLSQRTVMEIGSDIPVPFQQRRLASPPTAPALVTPPVTVPPPEPTTPPKPVEAIAPPPQPTPPSEPVEAVAPPSLDEEKFLINLNRCSAEDLLQIKGVGPALAARIIAWRTEHGQFNSIEELRLVPGIGRKTFRTLAGAKAAALNRLLGVAEDRQLTLQEIVHLTSQLPGLLGCMLATADGLLLTGELPPQFDKEAISVFAPQLFRRIARYTRELKVGNVQRFTIFTDQQPISVFSAEDVFLIVFHDSKHFSKRLLRLCERISAEIARLCRQRTTV